MHHVITTSHHILSDYITLSPFWVENVEKAYQTLLTTQFVIQRPTTVSQ